MDRLGSTVGYYSNLQFIKPGGLHGQIYGIPGLGRYFVQCALNRDYTLVMGVAVFYGVFIIVLNLIVDLLYGWLDPQIRVQGRKA